MNVIKPLVGTAFVLAIAVTFRADAIHPVADYRCLAQRAHYILLVEDRQTDRLILEDEMGPVVVTELVIKKKFRNSNGFASGPDRQFSLIVRRDMWGTAGDKLARSKLNLVFLQLGEQGPVPLAGGGGVFPYDNGVQFGTEKLNDAALQQYIDTVDATNCPLVLW